MDFKPRRRQPPTPGSLGWREKFLKQLERQNKSVATWCREQGFELNDAYMVLGGRTVGRRGKARKILSAMGGKPPQMFAATRPEAEAA